MFKTVILSAAVLSTGACTTTASRPSTNDIIPADFTNKYDEDTFRENLYFVAKKIGEEFNFIPDSSQELTSVEKKLKYEISYWQKRKNYKNANKDYFVKPADTIPREEIMTDDVNIFNLETGDKCVNTMDALMKQWAQEVAVIQLGSVKIATTDYQNISHRVRKDKSNRKEGFAYKLFLPTLPGEAIGVEGTDFKLNARVSGGMNDHALMYKASGDLRLKDYTPLDMIPGDQDAVKVDFAALVDRQDDQIHYGYNADVGSDLAGGGAFELSTKKWCERR